MKVTINKDVLQEGLQKVTSIVSTKSTLPILYNLLLKAEDDQLWLIATDLEVTVRTTVGAKISRSGSTTLPARRLSSIIRELPVGDIEINVDENDVATIKAGSSRFKIIGINDQEFPNLPQITEGRSFTLDQGVFRKMLTYTAYAVSQDESRHVLNGVLLSFREEKLTVVATDGRRMALYEEGVEFPEDQAGDAVVPTKTVNELLKTLGNEGGLKILCGTNQATFEFGTVFITSKLVDGTFPNFRQVIPSSCEERVALERDGLLNALRRVVLVSNATSTVTFTLTKNQLELSTKAQDVGEATETMPIKYSGKELAIAFNPDFLIDCLRNVTSDEVALEVSDDLSPGVVKCDAPFLYVLMPMRVR
ncbi:MAG TPA: DNA polymerase III subunit beta [Kiritimatiellia bacterium]|nr:DNA polymerase III subunit beta [Kiritimatiellia bacterium]